MKLLTIIFISYLSGLFAFSQSVYHDPTLDNIQNNLAYIDSDINALGGLSNNVGGVNISNNADLASRIAYTNGNVGIDVLSNVVTSSNFYGGNVSSQYQSRATNFAFSEANLASNAMMSTFGNVNFNTNFGVAYPNGYGHVMPVSLGSVNGHSFSFGLGSSALFNTTYGMAQSPFSYTTSNWSALQFVISEAILIAFATMFFLWSVDDLRTTCDKYYNQRQISGPTQAALGTNLDLPLGIGYAIFVTAGFVAGCSVILGSAFLPNSWGGGLGSIVAFLQFLDNAGSGIFNGQNYSNFSFITIELYDFCCYVPLFAVVAQFLTYLAFSNFLLWPTFMFFRMIFALFVR
jgi:hypothetical protein